MYGDLMPAEKHELVPYEPPVVRIELPPMEEAPSLMWQKRTMQRTPALESDVFVPFWQAFVTTVAIGVTAGLVALVMNWSWRVPAIVLGLAALIAWLWRLRLADSLLWATETLTGYDVNQDGSIGKPAKFTLVNPAAARAETDSLTRTGESEAAKAELLAFVHRSYTVGTSESAHGVKASGPDRAQYVRQRDVLLSLGIATWKNPARPKAGWKMAVSYKRALELIGKHVL